MQLSMFRVMKIFFALCAAFFLKKAKLIAKCFQRFNHVVSLL